MRLTRRPVLAALGALAVAAATGPALAEDAAVIDARVNLALEKLFTEVPGTRDLSQKAFGILVMPEVVKGGFILGGSYGEGALRLNDGSGYKNTAEYYSVGAASLGLQAGIQSSSHALFFLTQASLDKFRRADGWEAGADAEVTFPSAGMNVGTDTTTAQKPIVAFVFGQDGLLLGASLEGAKYSRIVR
ncbi:twin-arginine translocation pathway signal [Limibaculum sp. M0105]|uniref:Twin-arginine translocation pathway signal n=1 Tax=Thermohalobaculum xanthum TaxID=2753746 RepID=A0A8J7SDQ2_9RHOB|nr:YSC84-related protein [Thermohalobaculum xanthum]MBK0400202.1 twin-arginine translocation pathway signal [Thermohalobaculum xanthum]